MQNILERIVELCGSRHTSHLEANARQLSEIRRLARPNANVLTQILHDYIEQNQKDTVHRKNRLKGAMRILSM
jgi:hypothetical protein